MIIETHSGDLYRAKPANNPDGPMHFLAVKVKRIGGRYQDVLSSKPVLVKRDDVALMGWNKEAA